MAQAKKAPIEVPHIYSRFDLPPTLSNNGGSMTKPERVPGIDPVTHEEAPICTGATINVYDYIQSFRESSDLSCILRRFPETEVYRLEAPTGEGFDSYLDSPEDLLQVLQGRALLEREFEKLPLEDRRKYGMNINEWLVDSIRSRSKPAADAASASTQKVGVDNESEQTNA